MPDDFNRTEDPAGFDANNESQRIERDRQLILDAQARGPGAKLAAYTKLSGPGWLQSAITLGVGSLAASLYLGVLAGYGAMWWQPLAMILGIIMLSAIGYVTLSTGQRPFDAINQHVNPVLGWGWAIATLMANLVWCMPQYSLGTAALRQNLLPQLMGEAAMPGEQGLWAATGLLFFVTAVVIWFYDSGGWGVRLFEWLLKGMVAVIVISFFAVVARMSTGPDALDWGQILQGFIPNFAVLTQPSVEYSGVLSEAGAFREFWTDKIIAEQQQVMITGAATAVGINMTFLLPYSMLRKGWDRDFRGLAMFDLSTGLFIPYLLATSCVVIAAASQFHAQEAPGLVAEATTDGTQPTASILREYHKLLDERLKWEQGPERFAELESDELAGLRAGLPLADRRLAAMLVHRDAFDLAASLQRLSGRSEIAQLVFGVGVVGMAVSTIIILMLINGFVLTEITGQSGNRSLHRVGCFLASVVGALGAAKLWTGEARVWLAVPTSMFGMVLLPIAYTTFFLMMNSRSLMGENLPRGGRRVRWNLLMGLATAFATACCLWSISQSPQAVYGFAGLGAFALLAIVVHVFRTR